MQTWDLPGPVIGPSQRFGKGSVRIEVRFRAALANPITCLVLSEYDNTILIDKERNVSLDYLV